MAFGSITGTRFLLPSWLRRARLGCGLFVAFFLLGLSNSRRSEAGTFTYDFGTDPSTIPGVTIVGNNDPIWRNEGGNPGGFLALTYSENNRYSAVMFPDLDAGGVVKAFRFEADLRIGNSTGDRAGDGFSVSFARSNDRALADPPGSLGEFAKYAGGVLEGGTTTGIAVCCDTWSGNVLPDGPDIEGIIVRVDNITINRTALPTRHGACDDNTSLQTGARNPNFWSSGGDPRSPEAWASLCWKPLLIDLDETGKLSVTWKGRDILNKFQTTYFPSAGRFVLAGRTGGENQHTHFDNLRISTIASDPPVEPPVIQQVRFSTPTGGSPRVGDRVVFNVIIAQSATPTTYQWFFNGFKISGATGVEYEIPTATLQNQGNYAVEVSNSAGTVRSADTPLSILVPPVIQQVAFSTPGGAEPKLGDRIVFSAHVESSLPVTYRWFFNNSAISGATGAEYVIASVTAQDQGSYAVEVSSAGGTTRSAAVALNLVLPPVILQTVFTTTSGSPTPGLGEQVVFGVTVQSSGPISYQWFFNNAPIPGGTRVGHIIPSVTLQNQGEYFVEVSNAGGTTRGMTLRLSLRIDPPTLSAVTLSSPHGARPRLGDRIALAAQISSPVLVSFQWFFNNVAIAGATGLEYVIPSATRASQGDYFVEVSNSAGTVRSATLNLALTIEPPIVSAITISSPSGPSPSLGEPVTFSVEVTSALPVTYQWFFNGVAIAGGTDAQHVLAVATPLSQGEYAVEVANADGTARSEPAQLVVRSGGSGPQVLVTTIAGTNISGRVDATRGAEARFSFPNGLAHVGSGVVAVADGNNNAIRLVDRTGQTVTFAGANPPGYLDAAAALAQFNYPLGLRSDRALDLLVADTENNRIRKILAFGLRNVLTVAGNGRRGFKNGPALQAEFDFVNDLVADDQGNIFVIEFNNHTVRKISAEGQVTTLAGNGFASYRDGAGADSRFNQPAGIEIDPSGNLYVTEWGNHTVRKITPQGLVTTLAGTNIAGFADGAGASARFNQPDGITIDPMGNLYVTEHSNHAVRRIDPAGNVITVAGLGIAGLRDGDRLTAQFNGPGGILWHPDGALWVSDTDNHALRRIEFLSGTNSGAAELLIALHPALTIFGLPGASYRIEAAETTGAGAPIEWIQVDTVRLSGEVYQWHDPQPATRNQRLYRAIKVD